MRIFYFSNHIGDIDFNLLVKNTKNKPNPAGQNFHGRLLRALSLDHEVTCFSLVPSNEEGFKRKVGIKGNGIPHYYFYPPKRKILPNSLTLPKKIVRCIDQNFKDVKGDEVIVIYDTLNVALAKSAKIVAKKLHAKKIAICTDDPYNITGGGETYISSTLHYAKDADGYFCLTKGLEELFNPRCMPYRIHMGIAEKVDVEPVKLDKPYIYYGGALFYKDGTPALIDAYLEAKPNAKLVISGHGPEKARLMEESKINEDIVFLGQIGKDENAAYEAGAELCINPRLYRAYLDKVSVPSKVIEFLTYGKHIASTLSTPIKEEFKDSINWIASDPPKSTEQLTLFLKKHMDKEGNLVGFKDNVSSKDVLSHYGIEATAKVLTSLIEEVKTK